MNRERSLLLSIIGAVALVILVGMCSCSSTKKSVNKLAEEFEKTGWLKSDSSKSVKKDSSAVSSSTVLTKEVKDSGYEKETDETILEWIVNEDTPIAGGKDTIPAKSKVVYTKRKTREKGNQNSAKVTEDSRTAATSVTGSDSGTVKKDGAESSSGKTESTAKNVSKKKAFPGWAWLVGILAVLAVAGYFTKDHWFFALFPRKKKNHEA